MSFNNTKTSGKPPQFIKYRSLHEYALLRKIQHVHELQHVLWVLGSDAKLKL